MAAKLTRKLITFGTVIIGGKPGEKVSPSHFLVTLRDRIISQSSLRRSSHISCDQRERPQFCPICDDHRFRVYAPDYPNRTVVCCGCGMFYTNPLPSEHELRERVAGSSRYTEDQLKKVGFFTSLDSHVSFLN